MFSDLIFFHLSDKRIEANYDQAQRETWLKDPESKSRASSVRYLCPLLIVIMI